MGGKPSEGRPLAGNLFRDIAPRGQEEVTDILARGATARVLRITSYGQASPPGFWYDQDEDEWAAVLAGSARLTIEGRPGPLDMGPGDWVFLPAHLRHRVEATDPDLPTLWLAVFSKGAE